MSGLWRVAADRPSSLSFGSRSALIEPDWRTGGCGAAAEKAHKPQAADPRAVDLVEVRWKAGGARGAASVVPVHERSIRITR